MSKINIGKEWQGLDSLHTYRFSICSLNLDIILLLPTLSHELFIIGRICSVETQTALVDNVTYPSAKFTSSSGARPSPSLQSTHHLSLMLGPQITHCSDQPSSYDLGKNEEKGPRSKFLEKFDAISPQTF